MKCQDRDLVTFLSSFSSLCLQETSFLEDKFLPIKASGTFFFFPVDLDSEKVILVKDDLLHRF